MMSIRESMILEILEDLKEKEDKEFKENKFSKKWYELAAKVEILMELCSISGDFEVLENFSH